MLLVLKRTVSLRCLTPNFCMGVESLNTISYLSFGACVVCAQKNRLIKMAVIGTLNFCIGVEISNTNIYRSFEACVVGAQKNLLGCGDFENKFLSIFRGMRCWCSKQSSYRDGCFEYPQPLLWCENLKYKLLSVF